MLVINEIECGRSMRSARGITHSKGVLSMADVRFVPGGQSAVENQPINLLDQREGKSTGSDYRNLDTGLKLSGSALSLLGILGSRQMAPAGQLSSASADAIRASSADLRGTLVERVLLPAEQEMRGLGWQRIAKESNEVLWQAPANRPLLRDTNGAVYGQRGLPPNSDMWRNADGTVFHSRTGPFQRERVLVTQLTDDNMRSAANHNALKTNEVQAYQRLTEGTREVQQLRAVESSLHQTGLKPNEGLLAPRRSLEGVPSRNVAAVETALAKHNQALQAGSSELTLARQGYQRSNREALGSVGALLGAQAVNYAVDKYAFKDTPVSLRTSIADGLSPLVAVTSMHWSLKVGAIVGTHVAARVWDEWEARKER